MKSNLKVKTSKSGSHRFNSVAGFTLIETIMAAAISTVIIGGLLSGISMMSHITQQSTMASNAISFEQEMSDILKSGKSCSDALAGQKLNTNPGSGGSSAIKIKNIMTGGTTRTLDVNTQVEGSNANNGVFITDLTLKALKVQSVPMNKMISDVLTSTGTMKYYPATIHLQTMRKVNGVASMSLPVDYPVKVIVDGSGFIQKCNTDTSEATVCTESGGTWNPDPAVIPALRCTPKSNCQFGGSYSDPGTATAPNPGAYSNPVTNGFNCPNTFAPVRSGTVSAAARTSKYGIGNQYYSVFTCVKCGADFGTLGAPPVFTTGLVTTSDYNPEAGNVLVTYNSAAQDGTVAGAPTPTPVPAAPATTTSSTDPCYDSTGAYICGISLPGVGCFTGGTQVTMGDGTKKAIEDVKVGDQVLSYNERTSTPFVSTVTLTLHHPPAPQFLYDVYADDGKNFVANGVHWIYVVEARKYLSMKAIFEIFKAHKSVTIIDETGNRQRIAAIRSYESIERVYNLHVTGFMESGDFLGNGIGHNYFAGGILVHNMLSIEPTASK